MKEKTDIRELEKLIHKELTTVSNDYSNLETMLGIKPLKLKLIKEGSFQRYYEKKRDEGAELAHLKPPHTNATDEMVEELLR